MRETRVRSLAWEDPLEEETATHSSTLAWKIPWTKEPCRLQSVGLQRARHNWATSLHSSPRPETANAAKSYDFARSAAHIWLLHTFPPLAWHPAFPNLLSYQWTITFQLKIFAVIDSSSILFGSMGLCLFAISLHCLFRALHEGRKVSMFSLLSLTRRPRVVLGF